MLARAIQQAMGGIYPPDLNQYGKAIVFDPQDLDTLFQDSAGTTPVTGVEQPVGLMLDKGGGNYHATQPTASSRPTLSARYNMLVGTDTLATQSVTTLATDYTLSFVGSGTITLSGTAAGTLSAGTNVFTATAGTLTLTVTGSVTNASLVPVSTAYPDGLILGNNLCGGGEFDSATGWTVDAGWTVSGGKLNFSNTGSLTAATYNLSTSANTSYFVSFDLVVTSGSVVVRLGGGANFYSYTASGTYSLYMPSYGSYIKFISTAGTLVGSLDNVSVKEITNVVTGYTFPYQSVTNSTTYDSDLSKFPRYLKFTDHWMVAPSIDASTWNKVVVACGIRRMSDAAGGLLLELGNGTENGRFTLLTPSTVLPGNLITFGARGSVSQFAGSPDYPAPISISFVGTATIPGDNVISRINGAAVTTNGDLGIGNFNSALPVYLGKRAGSTYPFVGRYFGSTIAFVTALPNDNIIAALSRYYAQKAGIRI